MFRFYKKIFLAVFIFLIYLIGNFCVADPTLVPGIGKGEYAERKRFLFPRLSFLFTELEPAQHLG